MGPAYQGQYFFAGLALLYDTGREVVEFLQACDAIVIVPDVLVEIGHIRTAGQVVMLNGPDGYTIVIGKLNQFGECGRRAWWPMTTHADIHKLACGIEFDVLKIQGGDACLLEGWHAFFDHLETRDFAMRLAQYHNVSDVISLAQEIGGRRAGCKLQPRRARRHLAGRKHVPIEVNQVAPEPGSEYGQSCGGKVIFDQPAVGDAEIFVVG